jgi:anti-sigma regulatory factor (Ser/Thr protein kinase)
MSHLEVDNLLAHVDNSGLKGCQSVTMTSVRGRGEQIRIFILDQVQKHPRDIQRLVAEQFSISRQAVNKHLQNLVHEKALYAEGHTRNRVYRLTPLVEWSKTYDLAPALAEDVVWRTDIEAQLGELPDNVLRIWHYAFTEMFNNVIDHSGAQWVIVRIHRTAASTEMLILDNGVGIFRKIQAALQLLDERHSVLELSKGKLTTDPAHHTGEGIFFTSRVLDEFKILSGGVFFSHKFGDDEDWILEQNIPSEGTAVFMRLHNHTSRTTKSVFDQYISADEDFGFTKTVVPVRLAQYGDDNLVSRSQAKRLLARVDRFRTVLLNFEGVESIGHSFADEIFRVFRSQHPQVDLSAINAKPDVMAMIARVTAGNAS